VVFQEQGNAHGKSTEKPAEGIEFPETAAKLNDETHEVEETDMMEMNNSSRLQDSKLKKKKNTSLCRCHQRVGSDMSCWAELCCY